MPRPLLQLCRLARFAGQNLQKKTSRSDELQPLMFKMSKPTDQAAELPRLDTDATVEVLNRILHFELSGVMQHFHHHWMSRRLRSSRPRAIAIGQHIASLTGGPSVGVGNLMDEAVASADEMLAEARTYERRRVEEYRRLLELVAGRSEGLEAFARAQIAAEEHHVAEAPLDAVRLSRGDA